MTSVMVFIRPGTPGQLSVGAMITFLILLIVLFWRPFCSSNLNNLSSGTLIAEFCTLFVGIMIVLLDAMPAGTVEGEGDDSLDRSIISFMVVAVHGVALGWPFLHKVLSGKLSVYYDMTIDVYHWCCSKYVRLCGSKEQRAQIATIDAKIKKKKEREKGRTKEAEAAAKAALMNADTQTQATSHSEVDVELGIVRERQIPENTAPGQSTSTQTAFGSSSLPPGWRTAKDQAGYEYYYNKELNVTQRSRPAPSGGTVHYSLGWS